MHQMLKVSSLLVAVTVLFTSCGERNEVAWNLSKQDQYRLPASASTVPPMHSPVLFARKSGGELVGKVTADPLASIDDILEQSITEVATQLRYVRRALDDHAGDEMAPFDALLALDQNLTYDEVMQVIYGAAATGFPHPHLVTRRGTIQSVEPPDLRSGVPTGWSAWMWIARGDTVRWMAVPESALDPSKAEDVWIEKVLPTESGIDIEKVAKRITAVLDTIDFIPEPEDRLIGIWAYSDFPYTDLIALMDRLRYPKRGAKVGDRITLLAGRRWGAPPDSGLTVRFAE